MKSSPIEKLARRSRYLHMAQPYAGELTSDGRQWEDENGRTLSVRIVGGFAITDLP